jgi:hypothetical protein
MLPLALGRRRACCAAGWARGSPHVGTGGCCECDEVGRAIACEGLLFRPAVDPCDDGISVVGISASL